MDSHYVKTADLVKYVRPFVAANGIQYLVLRLAGNKRMPMKLSNTSEWTLVTRILALDSKFTEFKVADRVLVAMGCPHVTLTLYPRKVAYLGRPPGSRVQARTGPPSADQRGWVAETLEAESGPRK